MRILKFNPNQSCKQTVTASKQATKYGPHIREMVNKIVDLEGAIIIWQKGLGERREKHKSKIGREAFVQHKQIVKTFRLESSLLQLYGKPEAFTICLQVTLLLVRDSKSQGLNIPLSWDFIQPTAFGVPALRHHLRCYLWTHKWEEEASSLSCSGS